MKILFMTIGGLIAVAGLAGVAIAATTGKTEQRPYRVILTDGDFEIRYYPESIAATYVQEGENRNSSFRVLANYIFGGNKENESIAMTAPVLMEEEEGRSEMTFFMPSGYSLENLPEPNDASVKLHPMPAIYAATIQFSGFAKPSDYAKNSQQLKAWLEEKAVEHDNHFVNMGYDPPYNFINRRNEVMVELVGYKEQQINLK